MATRSFPVKGYEVNAGSKMTVNVQGAPVACQAIIQCRGGPDESFDVIVVADSQSRPNLSQIDTTRVAGRMFVPPEQFVWYLDMVRNESVVAHVDDSTPLLNRLSCGSPAGWGYFG